MTDETPTTETDDAVSEYGRQVGERMRAIRRQKRLSLHDVESLSEQEFKASVLGAYERGERAISVPRLQRLARFYSVPVDQLLPRDDVTGGFGTEGAVVDLVSSRLGDRASFTIDLARVEQMSGPEAAMLTRFLASIQVQRQDFNGRVLTIRNDDLRAIACILGIDPNSAETKLADFGLFNTAR
ncbi:MAG: helix-turn-helix domain-containing protein [Acidimicrobiales bacterium]